MNCTDTRDTAKVESRQGNSSRPEAEINIDEQCAVPLPSGAQCARGLNCKRHGMSAKRAVPGRSAPFDQLLAIYQPARQLGKVSGYVNLRVRQRDFNHYHNSETCSRK